MPRWQVIAWLIAVWTGAMATWFALYRARDATCGPEIYRDCEIGLKVTGGLGRPGIVLLWVFVVVALGLASLTRQASKFPRREEPDGRTRRGTALRLAAPVAATLAAVLVPALTVFTAVRVTRSMSAEAPPSPRPGAAPEVRVVSAILHPAATPSGRRRNAARLSVHVRVADRGPRPSPSRLAALLSGGQILLVDTTQVEAAGSLLIPDGSGAVGDGVLRFEPRSQFTERLWAERRARLRIAGQTVPLKLKIGRPVR